MSVDTQGNISETKPLKLQGSEDAPQRTHQMVKEMKGGKKKASTQGQNHSENVYCPPCLWGDYFCFDVSSSPSRASELGKPAMLTTPLAKP